MSQTVASKSPTLSPNPKLVGRYSVLRELRRDRYTTVYLAFDPVLNRELVVKSVQLHPASAQDRAAHERVEQAFMRQAQAAGRLHHPHIVTVFDAGHVNRIGYIALEKVDGKMLDELLTEGYRPGFLQAADIVARVADAVEFAHARAIPHGHLSPSRIYLQGPERTPKVMGFGGWIDSGMTGDFELHGTDRLLPYFGDELSGEARRKDIRALGALLFLLLTGTRPDVKTLRAQGKMSESPILQLKPNAPLALAEIAEQALELGGTRVFATAAQVRNALTTYLWGNRGDMPLPGSATITGMPARLDRDTAAGRDDDRGNAGRHAGTLRTNARQSQPVAQARGGWSGRCRGHCRHCRHRNAGEPIRRSNRNDKFSARHDGERAGREPGIGDGLRIFDYARGDQRTGRRRGTRRYSGHRDSRHRAGRPAHFADAPGPRARCGGPGSPGRYCARSRPLGYGLCQRGCARHDPAANTTDLARRPLHNRDSQRRAHTVHCTGGCHS